MPPALAAPPLAGVPIVHFSGDEQQLIVAVQETEGLAPVRARSSIHSRAVRAALEQLQVADDAFEKDGGKHRTRTWT